MGTCKSNLERVNHAMGLLTTKQTKTSEHLDEVTTHRNKIVVELGQCNTLLKLRDSECVRLLRENNATNKSRDILQKKIMMLEQAKGDLVQEVLKFKNTVVTFEKERDANKKAFDRLKKFGDEMLRERDLVRKDLQRAQRTISEQLDTIQTGEAHAKALDLEIKTHLEAARRQRAVLAKVEKERDKNAEESQILSDRLEKVQDELTGKINYIYQLNEDIAEMKTKMAQTQQLFESARSERNAFQRDLQATVEDRDDIRERLRVSSSRGMDHGVQLRFFSDRNWPSGAVERGRFGERN